MIRKKSENSESLSHYVDSCNSKEREELDKTVAQFFYGCNISFTNIESPHFKKLIKCLKPSYEQIIPSRKILSGRLLNSTYQDCLKEARSSLPSNSVLLIDGWKNSSSNSKTVVSMIHNANGNRAFLNAWDLSGESETAAKLAEIVCESIDLAKSLYSTNVYAVVSDNASNMIRMGKNVNHIVWHSTCNSHTGNLLAKDIVDAHLSGQANSVLKEFKNTDLESAVLSKGGKRIKLVCDTRWCSHRDAYGNLLNNLQFLKQIIIDEKPKKVKSCISKLIFDDEFIEKVKEEKEMLDPVCKLINFCQKSDSSLVDAAYMWLSFEFNGKNSYKEKMQTNYKRRCDMVLNDYALVGYYLHPFYDNELLTGDHQDRINHFLLKNLSGDGIEEWHFYKNRLGLFEVLYNKGIKKPHIFWSTAEMKYPELSKLALKILNLPASSAQIERIFSNWGQIHTSIRNRLTFERSKKLLHIYFALNNKQNLREKVQSSDDDNDCD